MSGTQRRNVRIFRTPDREGRLVLDDGTGLWDLTGFLTLTGQPTDLVHLFEAGWFDAASMANFLPGSTGEGRWEPAELDREKVGLPITRSEVGKILALGKNFRAHAEEFGETLPSEPLVFNKLPETLVPHRAEVTVPGWYAGRVDHEAELAAVIGLGGAGIAVEDAMEHVAGYTIANDLTARSLQSEDRERRHPWFRSKNLDGFCPLGPCFVPRDFLDTGALHITCSVNGELRQDASTAEWAVDLPHAVAWISRHITLHPGDLILTGTPAGVAPLLDGDQVVCAVEGIGELVTTIRRPTA